MLHVVERELHHIPLQCVGFLPAGSEVTGVTVGPLEACFDVWGQV